MRSNSADFDLICDSGDFITFNEKIYYVDTIISSDLRDCPDIGRRINQGSRAFVSSVSCNQKQRSPIIRRRLFVTIVTYLLLWGCERWALLSEDCNQLNICFKKWIRAMTWTRWREIREKHLTNKQLRESLVNIESVDDIYNRRCLNWFENGKYASNRIREPPPGNSLVLGASIVVVPAADRGKLPARHILTCLIISNLTKNIGPNSW